MSKLFLYLIPLALALAHYVGLHRTIKNKSLLQNLRSFSGGFSVAYVFLIVFPEIYQLNNQSPIDTLVLTVIGFALFHVLLKFIFKQRSSKKRTLLLDEIHTGTAALYSFLLAFSLVEISKQNMTQSMVLVILIILHTTLSELSRKELTHHAKAPWKTPFLITATLLGGLLPIIQIVTSSLTATLYAFAAGAIIYITIREEVPEGKEGSPSLFIMGVFLLIIARLYI